MRVHRSIYKSLVAATLGFGVAAQSVAESNECPAFDVILKSTRAHFPEIKVQAQRIKETKGSLLSAKGSFDFVAKTDAAARLDGFYTGDYADARIEKPLTYNGATVLSGYRGSRGTFPPYEEDYQTASGGEWYAGVQVPVFKGREIDERRAELKIADTLVSQAGFEAESVQLQVEREAADVYLRWRAAHGIAAVFKQLLKQAEDRLSQTAQGVAAGDRAGIDTVDANRLVLKRSALLKKSQAEIKKIGAVLSLYYRDDEGEPIALNQSRNCASLGSYAKERVQRLLTPAQSELEEQARERSPILKAIDSSITITKTQGSLAENSLLPKLDLGVQVARDIGSGSKSTADNELKSILKFELPLERRQAKGKQLAVKAKQSALNHKRSLLLQKIHADVEKAEEKRLSFGDSSLLLVNVREQTLAEAEVSVVEARVAISQALADVRLILSEGQAAEDLGGDAK
jgi:hypothetical protein